MKTEETSVTMFSPHTCLDSEFKTVLHHPLKLNQLSSQIVSLKDISSHFKWFSWLTSNFLQRPELKSGLNI